MAPFTRRRLAVTGMDELGAYRVLRVADPDAPEPDPGQFAMLAAAERWGGGDEAATRKYAAELIALAPNQ